MKHASAANRVWLLLIGATLASFFVAEDLPQAQLASSLVVLIAAFKIRMIFLHFMELSEERGGWRMIFEVWTVAVTAIVLLGFWVAELKY